MSRGPGRIERAIRALFDASPDLAFVTDELVEHCYPDAKPIERKHQVAVLRAAWNVVARDPNWGAIRGRNGDVFCNFDNVQSYGLAQLIHDGYWHTKSERWAKRHRAWWGEDSIRKNLLLNRERLIEHHNGKHQQDCAPGGIWYRWVEVHRAERDGDGDRAATIRTDIRAGVMGQMGQLLGGAGISKRCRGPDDGQETTLNHQPTDLATRLRALMAQNDPDVVRAGLADMAAALDAAGGAP